MKFLGAGALALGLALSAVGCGNHGGSLTGFIPAGRGGALLLLDVQPDAPDTSTISVFGVVYDSSEADGFRLYADPGGVGFRPATDFISSPTHTYSTGEKEYRMRSLVFEPAVLNSYIARGARRGFETGAAPTTEVALVLSPSPSSLARRVDVPLVSPADSAETDSVPTLSWAPVAGASRYLLRILGRNGVTYLVIVDGTTHQVEGVNPAIRLEDLPMRPGLLYHWEVEAIDGVNRIFGKTRVTRALLVTRF